MSTFFRHFWSMAALLAATASATGCGGATGGGEVRVRTEVHLVRGDAREPLGEDPEQARTRAAAAALEKAVGRSVAIDVDAALTPATKSGLDTQTASSLEGLARYFADIGTDALVADFVKRKLSRIVVKYRASAEWAEAAFDDKNGALVFTMREASWSGWLPSRFELDHALDDALVADLAARFAGRSVEQLGANDLEPYYRLLTSRTRAGKTEDLQRAQRLEALLRLEPRTRGQALGVELEDRLADSAAFVLARERQTPPLAPMRAAYASWVQSRFFAMSGRARSTLYEQLVGRTVREPCEADPCPTLPELDRTKLALAFFTQPVPADEKDFGAFDQALCLGVEKAGRLDRGRSCQSVYPFLLATDARAERLVDTLVATKKREQLVAALTEARGKTGAFLAALERRGGPLYAEAVRIVLDVDEYRLRDHRRTTLLREVTRLWPKRADLRPLLLRVVVEDYVASGRDDEAFARLVNELGPIDAQLFARFLDEGPRSVELAPRLWPALKGVGAPFEIVAARLDGFVTKRGIDASKTISGLVRRACDARDNEGLRVVRAVLERRVKAGDKDAIALALAARDCKSPRID